MFHFIIYFGLETKYSYLFLKDELSWYGYINPPFSIFDSSSVDYKI